MRSSKNIGRNDMEQMLRNLPGLDMTYRKSHQDVWNELSESIDSDKEDIPLRHLSSGRIWLSLAASVVVLVGVIAFMRLYSEEIVAVHGKHLATTLPDGSKVTLNAGTKVAYHPFWWILEREVTLEGEAFFEVEKGEKFEVISSHGKTTVLGTSFNIYARNNHYQVTCYTGKVRVISSVSGHSLDILPHEQASLNSDGSLRLSRLKDAGMPVSWMNNMFVFTATPIDLVLGEIERQYAVEIKTEGEYSYLYTGNFTRNQPVEQVLKTVCRPYGLTFEKIENGYLIVKK
jgi:ferric-dicitrate binding protein FerR (iron transport regulator)